MAEAKKTSMSAVKYLDDESVGHNFFVQRKVKGKT